MAAKINMRLDKNEMPSQDPNVRNKNFLEVAWATPSSRRWTRRPAACTARNIPAWTAAP